MVENAYNFYCMCSVWFGASSYVPCVTSMTRMSMLEASKGEVNCIIGPWTAFTKHRVQVDFLSKPIHSQYLIFPMHFTAHLVKYCVWYHLISLHCNCLETSCKRVDCGGVIDETVRTRMTYLQKEEIIYRCRYYAVVVWVLVHISVIFEWLVFLAMSLSRNKGDWWIEYRLLKEDNEIL